MGGLVEVAWLPELFSGMHGCVKVSSLPSAFKRF